MKSFLCCSATVLLVAWAAASGAPATGPAGAPATGPVGGVVSVRAAQRTAGGASPAGAAVYVDVLAGQRVIRQEAKLDENGLAIVGGLPLPCQPLVTVVHQGVEYRAMGRPMDASQARQDVEVGVHDATGDEPPWAVKIRHVLVRGGRNVLQVTEVLALENPSDRSWTGRNDASGKPVTLQLRLPPGAQKVGVGGQFDECCTEVAEGVLLSRSAIIPGVTQYHVQYELPARDGRVEFDLTAPAAVRHTMLMLADDGTEVVSPQMAPVNDPQVSARGMRLLAAGPVEKGRVISVRIAGLDKLTTGEARQAATDGGTALKLVAGFAAGIVLMAGLAAVLVRRRKGDIPPYPL